MGGQKRMGIQQGGAEPGRTSLYKVGKFALPDQCGGAFAEKGFAGIINAFGQVHKCIAVLYPAVDPSIPALPDLAGAVH